MSLFELGFHCFHRRDATCSSLNRDDDDDGKSKIFIPRSFSGGSPPH